MLGKMIQADNSQTSATALGLPRRKSTITSVSTRTGFSMVSSASVPRTSCRAEVRQITAVFPHAGSLIQNGLPARPFALAEEAVHSFSNKLGLLLPCRLGDDTQPVSLFFCQVYLRSHHSIPPLYTSVLYIIRSMSRN